MHIRRLEGGREGEREREREREGGREGGREKRETWEGRKGGEREGGREGGRGMLGVEVVALTSTISSESQRIKITYPASTNARVYAENMLCTNS